MNIYVLVAEWGEYEQHMSLRGVFSTLEGAIDAAQEMPRLSEESYHAYLRFEKKVNEWLHAHGTVERQYPPDDMFPSGFTVYRNDDYYSAKRAAGTEPPIWIDNGRTSYFILEASLDCNSPDCAPRKIWSKDADGA